MRRIFAVVALAGALLAVLVACSDDTSTSLNVEPSAATVSQGETIRRVALERTQKARVDFSSPSLVFPAGTTYEEGLLEFFLIEAGEALAEPPPVTAALGAPLPRGTAVSLPTEQDPQLRISLAAPYGYDVASGVPLLSPLRSAPPSSDGELSSAGPWVRGTALPIPQLPPCMISLGMAPPTRTCTEKDIVRIDDPAIALP